MKLLVVLNPDSGSVQNQPVEEMIRDVVDSQGIKDVRYCEISELDNEDCDVDRVVAVGGDGTVSACAKFAMECHAQVGIVPGGTGNLLAKMLGLPLDLREACALAVSSDSMRMLDAMEIEGRLYFLHVSVGWSSKVFKETSDEMKGWLGMVAYWINAVRTWEPGEEHAFVIEADGEEIAFTSGEVVVSNFNRLNDEIVLDSKERGEPDDGLIEVYRLRENSVSGVMGLIAELVLRKKRRRNLEFVGQYEKVRISASKDLEMQGDGDVLGKLPMEVRVLEMCVGFVC